MGSSHSQQSRQQSCFPKPQKVKFQKIQAAAYNCWVGDDNSQSDSGGRYVVMSPIGLHKFGLHYCAMRNCPRQPRGQQRYWRPLLSDLDDKIVWHNTTLRDGTPCAGVFHASCFSSYLNRRYPPHKGRVPRPTCPCCDGAMNVAWVGCSRENPMGFEKFTGHARL